MHARITLEDTALFADPSGALFWTARRTLVVADLQLAKGSGRAALLRLQSLIRKYTPVRIVCLGALPPKVAPADREFLARLVKLQEWIWVGGRKDRDGPTEMGGTHAAEIVEDKLALRHRPAGAQLGYGEIVGHFQPQAAVTTAAGRMVAPCFLLDGRRLVMPAFGAEEGGRDVLEPAISQLFGRVRVRALLLGRERLQLFPGHRLEPVIAGTRARQ